MMERAIGMLAVRLAVDLETAAAVLRLVARDTRQPQPVLASAVISGEATIALPLSVTFAAATGELV
jgi:hypothetical protein